MRAVVSWLSWFHRWTGVAFCLLFAVWFASGLVLVFVPFPALTAQDRWAAAEPVALSALAVDPATALANGGGGEELRLVSVAGRPTYVVTRDGASMIVDGHTGAVRESLAADEAGAIAARFAAAPVRSVQGPFDYDQWIVHQKFDPWRPLYRVSLDDAEGTALYVSARTGEVVQRTRATERAWNWVGSIPHWIYFTALRRSFSAWDRTVWWLALAALCSACAGTVLGTYRTWQRARSARPAWSPFRGWFRWHHGLGLAAAVFVLAWIFSGWLSMDHGRLFSRGVLDADAVSRYAGRPLAAALQGIPAAALSPLQGATEIDFSVVGGRPVAVGRSASGSRVSAGIGGTGTAARLPPAWISEAASQAWRLRPVQPAPGVGEALYRSGDAIPADAVRLVLDHPASTAVYIDAASGRPLAQLDTSRRVYAWVYLAVHTTAFPGLPERPLLRRVLQVLPLLLGLAFTVTGMVLGVRRLAASIPRARRAALR